MQIKKQDTYTLIKQEEKENFKVFFKSLSSKIDIFKNQNLIVNLTANTKVKDMLLLTDIAVKKTQENTSFIVVCKAIDIDKIPEIITIAPTLLEANDILEMDEITRELGF